MLCGFGATTPPGKTIFLTKWDNILIFPLAAENLSSVEIWFHEKSPQCHCASSEHIIGVHLSVGRNDIGLCSQSNKLFMPCIFSPSFPLATREGGWKDKKWRPIFLIQWTQIERLSHVKIYWTPYSSDIRGFHNFSSLQLKYRRFSQFLKL